MGPSERVPPRELQGSWLASPWATCPSWVSMWVSRQEGKGRLGLTLEQIESSLAHLMLGHSRPDIIYTVYLRFDRPQYSFQGMQDRNARQGARCFSLKSEIWFRWIPTGPLLSGIIGWGFHFLLTYFHILTTAVCPYIPPCPSFSLGEVMFKVSDARATFSTNPETELPCTRTCHRAFLLPLPSPSPRQAVCPCSHPPPRGHGPGHQRFEASSFRGSLTDESGRREMDEEPLMEDKTYVNNTGNRNPARIKTDVKQELLETAEIRRSCTLREILQVKPKNHGAPNPEPIIL